MQVRITATLRYGYWLKIIDVDDDFFSWPEEQQEEYVIRYLPNEEMYWFDFEEAT